MKGKVLAAVLVTALVLIICAAATGLFSFMAWALALNGFMGQERAVNASMITFIVLAILFSVVCIGLGIFIVYFLAGKREWNAIGSAILSIVIFATATGGLQLLSVIISTIVASEMRTTR